jgi:dUTP pyrophosphatase
MNLDDMKKKVLLVADPNSGYTQEDFNNEFALPITGGIVQSDYDPYKIVLGFVNKSTNIDPEYATAGSSGFDLRADLTESVIIEPHKTAIIPTGLFFEIPNNFEIQIRPRSGMAAKNGITVLNSPGTIDADYRGEIKVILVNHSDDRYMINHGDRIAQAVVASVISKNIVSLTKRDEISTDTERGSGGFGSTGKK